MSKTPFLRHFQDRFPTEDGCLDHLFQVRYGTDFACPKCERPAKYSRMKSRRTYTAGTPFDRTRTSLLDWFYVMFLFTTTRNGVAAKRVERSAGSIFRSIWASLSIAGMDVRCLTRCLIGCFILSRARRSARSHCITQGIKAAFSFNVPILFPVASSS
jgi:hypothetical protein